jgi:hypothetical protein
MPSIVIGNAGSVTQQRRQLGPMTRCAWSRCWSADAPDGAAISPVIAKASTIGATTRRMIFNPGAWLSLETRLVRG